MVILQGLLYLCLTSSSEDLRSLLIITTTDSCSVREEVPVLLQSVLSDVCAMESVEFASSVEHHLQTALSPLVEHFLSLKDPNGRGCLLTDSHVPHVLSHQLRTLRDEFSEQFLVEKSVADENHLVHTLLTRLMSLEKAYAIGVRDCKHKDIGRAAGIIADYSARVERHIQAGAMSTDIGKASDVLSRDATIQAARKRADHVELCVERVLKSFM
jgi:hypothetical protein